MDLPDAGVATCCTKSPAFAAGLEQKLEMVQSPVPVRLDVCGLLLALSLTVSVPVAEPVAVGENVTLIVQLSLLFSVVEQVVVETSNGPVVE
jgi:hypothetical protein